MIPSLIIISGDNIPFLIWHIIVAVKVLSTYLTFCCCKNIHPQRTKQKCKAQWFIKVNSDRTASLVKQYYISPKPPSCFLSIISPPSLFRDNQSPGIFSTHFPACIFGFPTKHALNTKILPVLIFFISEIIKNAFFYIHLIVFNCSTLTSISILYHIGWI